RGQELVPPTRQGWRVAVIVSHDQAAQMLLGPLPPGLMTLGRLVPFVFVGVELFDTVFVGPWIQVAEGANPGGHEAIGVWISVKPDLQKLFLAPGSTEWAGHFFPGDLWTSVTLPGQRRTHPCPPFTQLPAGTAAKNCDSEDTWWRYSVKPD